MQEEKTLRVVRDKVGWVVEGDRHPRSYADRAQAIARAEVVARESKVSLLVIADEQGQEESRQTYQDGKLVES
jgi:hypothetical protein